MNQKFTGQERDVETNLDYFGARYCGASLGRFTSPDWSGKPEPIPYANLENPQSLNLYAYTANNPLLRADLDGHCVTGFTWLCNVGQRIHNEFTGLGWHTNNQVDQIVEQTRQSLRKAGIDSTLIERLSYKQTYRLGTAKFHDGKNIINLGGLILAVTVGAMPRLDATGKVHGELPDHVPENWTKSQLEELETDLQKSIETRQQEQTQLGEDGPHRARVQQEERLLRQIQKKLGGS